MKRTTATRASASSSTRRRAGACWRSPSATTASTRSPSGPTCPARARNPRAAWSSAPPRASAVTVAITAAAVVGSVRGLRRGGFSLGFGLIKQALQSLGGSEHPVSSDELREAVAEIKGDEPVAPAQVNKILRQAHDRELVDLAKEEDGGYSVRL